MTGRLSFGLSNNHLERRGPSVFVPRDPAVWAKQLEEYLQGNECVNLSICSTDEPGLVAVGFIGTDILSGPDIQDLMRSGKAFGFYIDTRQARELAALFTLIAEAEAS